MLAVELSVIVLVEEQEAQLTPEMLWEWGTSLHGATQECLPAACQWLPQPSISPSFRLLLNIQTPNGARAKPLKATLVSKYIEMREDTEQTGVVPRKAQVRRAAEVNDWISHGPVTQRTPEVRQWPVERLQRPSGT